MRIYVYVEYSSFCELSEPFWGVGTLIAKADRALQASGKGVVHTTEVEAGW